VTRGAILRRLILAMATDAGAHVALDQRVRGSGLGHLAMASGAIHLGANVGRVLKLDQSLQSEAVDPLPGHLVLLAGLRNELLNLRPIGGHFGVAEHAFHDRRDGGRGTGIGRAMAIDVVQPERDVLLCASRRWAGRTLPMGARHKRIPEYPGAVTHAPRAIQLGLLRGFTLRSKGRWVRPVRILFASSSGSRTSRQT
jgi:hypothetical protein